MSADKDHKKLNLVNQLPKRVTAIDQYAIMEGEQIIGGFTLALSNSEMLMLGFHSEVPGSLLWVFRDLRRLYPHIKRLVAYRATGRGVGQRAWNATANGWIAAKGK